MHVDHGAQAHGSVLTLRGPALQALLCSPYMRAAATTSMGACPSQTMLLCCAQPCRQQATWVMKHWRKHSHSCWLLRLLRLVMTTTAMHCCAMCDHRHVSLAFDTSDSQAVDALRNCCWQNAYNLCSGHAAPLSQQTRAAHTLHVSSSCQGLTSQLQFALLFISSTQSIMQALERMPPPLQQRILRTAAPRARPASQRAQQCCGIA